MAESTQEQSPAVAQGSLQTVIVGTSIIMWILAVWLIMTVNDIKAELETIKEYTKASVQMNNSPAAFQLVTPDGNVAYKIEMVPVEMIDEGSVEPPTTETPTPAPTE